MVYLLFISLIMNPVKIKKLFLVFYETGNYLLTEASDSEPTKRKEETNETIRAREN